MEQAPDVFLKLGTRLAEARQARGLSQAELADRLKMAEEQVAALEAGNSSRLPESVYVVAQARRIAQVLGVEIDAEITALHAERPPLKRAPPALVREVVGLPDPDVEPDAAPPPQGHPSARPARRASVPWIVVAPLAAVLAAGVAAALVVGRLPRPRPATPPSEPETATPQAATPSQDAEPAASNVQRLVLRSGEPSWLEVRSLAGEILFEGTFSGERVFALGNGVRVIAGRPDLVTAALGDAPARPLGVVSRIEWRTFTPVPPSSSPDPSSADRPLAAPHQIPPPP